MLKKHICLATVFLKQHEIKTKQNSFLLSEMPQLCPLLLPLQKVQILIFFFGKFCCNNRCYSQIKAVNFVDSDLHTTAQERGSLKGLLPVGTPTSRASLPAFCRQYCWSSAAAWDTWEHKHSCEFISIN